MLFVQIFFFSPSWRCVWTEFFSLIIYRMKNDDQSDWYFLIEQTVLYDFSMNDRIEWGWVLIITLNTNSYRCWLKGKKITWWNPKFQTFHTWMNFHLFFFSFSIGGKNQRISHINWNSIYVCYGCLLKSTHERILSFSFDVVRSFL